MKTRKMKIQTKNIIAIVLIAIACCVGVGMIVYSTFIKIIIQHSKTDAMSLVSVAANEVDGETFASIDAAEGAAWDEVYNTLSKYKEANTIEYVYTMAKDGDNLHFVVDTDEEDPADFGEEYEWIEDMAPAFKGEVCCDEEVTTDEWGTYYSAYGPIMKGDEVVGIVGMDIPVTTIEEDMKGVKKEIAIIVIIAIFISIVYAIIYSLNMGRNLREFYDKVTDINSGDGDLTKKLEITSGDELEEIAGEFNKFIETIRQVFAAFAETVKDIEGTSLDVSEMSGSNISSISDMTVSLQALSAQMNQTSAVTSEVKEKLSEVATSVRDLNERAKNRSDYAIEISGKANARREEIIVVESKTRGIIEGLQKSMDAALEEAKAVDQIDDITNQILKVARTTKILALNAHTEAARAGEAGKGFNIIADDVGNLSAQISTLVMNIQAINQQVKESVNNLSENVANMTTFMHENVMEDYSTFAKMGEEYGDNMTRMSEILGHVSEITEVIDGTVRKVDMQLVEMDTVINTSVDEIRAVYERSMDIKSGNDSMNDAAKNNVEDVRKMHDKVDQFVY